MRSRVAAVAALAVLAAAGSASVCGGDKPAPTGELLSSTATRPVVTQEPTATRDVAPSVTPIVPSPAPNARQLILVPFQGFPVPVLERLRDYFHDTYGIPVSVAPAVPLTEDSFNRARDQIIGERLLDLLTSEVVRARADVVVGLTQYDMMIEDKPEWRFAFAQRSASQGVGVVSMARMDPRLFGGPPDDELFFHRALKMVAKHLGILYYGLDTSTDPTSVMYGNVLSVRDLDVMGERLPVP